jgi:glutaredoxin
VGLCPRRSSLEVVYRRKLREFEQKETKETKTDEDRVSVPVIVIGQVVRGGALSASVSSLEVVYRRKLREFEQRETKTDVDRISVPVIVIGQVVRREALSESVSSLEVVYRRKLREFEQKETKETKTDEDRFPFRRWSLGKSFGVGLCPRRFPAWRSFTEGS